MEVLTNLIVVIISRHVSQIITLHTLTPHNVIYQLHLYKARQKRPTKDQLKHMKYI